MVIACLGEEIAKVVDPVKKYSADIVIGLHDCFRNKETYPIRSIIMGKSQEELEKYNPNMLTIYLEHDLNNFVEISNFLESPNSTSGGIGSLNHYSKGAVCEWLFKEMCGIHVDGENHFVIAPLPGGRFSFAEASYNSVYGSVSSGWKHEENRTIYTITIPANCSADVVLPSGRTDTVSAGTHVYTEESK